MNIFSKFRVSFGDTLTKFYTTLGIAFAAFCVTSYMILKNLNPDRNPQWFHLVLALIVAGFVALYFDVTMRHKLRTWARVIPARVLVAFTVGALYYAFPKDSIFFNMAITGASAAIFLWTIFLLFTETNRNRVVSILFKTFTMATTMTTMIFAGLTISLSAVNFLLFRMENYGEYVAVIGAFSWMVLFPLFLLGLADKEKSTQETSPVIRVLAYSIALPLFALLTTILYIYLAKIVITWSFPSNRINWYASFAALTFIVLSFLIPQYDTKFSRIFTRFGGLWMLPIIAVQIIAINIRFQAYGLTTARWISICCVFIAIAFMLISMVKNMRYIKILFPLTAIIALLLTVGPFNAIDFPIREQTARLDSLLTANSMLKDDKIIARSDISVEAKRKILGSYNMLENSSYQDDHKLIPARYASRIDKEKYLGFSEADLPPVIDPVTGDEYPQGETMREVSHEWGAIDTTGYTKVMYYDSWRINNQDSKEETSPYGEVYINGKTYNIADELALIDDSDKSYEDLIIDLDESTRLVISTVSVRMVASPNNYFTLQGIVLMK